MLDRALWGAVKVAREHKSPHPISALLALLAGQSISWCHMERGVSREVGNVRIILFFQRLLCGQDRKHEVSKDTAEEGVGEGDKAQIIEQCVPQQVVHSAEPMGTYFRVLFSSASPLQKGGARKGKLDNLKT